MATQAEVTKAAERLQKALRESRGPGMDPKVEKAQREHLKAVQSYHRQQQK